MRPEHMRAAQALRVLEAERARRDAHWFLFESGRLLTKDEHDLSAAVKPFPDRPYLRALLDCLLVAGRLLPPERARWALEAGIGWAALEQMAQSGVVFFEKSRQMVVTWLVCAYILWRARSRPHQLCLVQSKKEDDAANLVFNKDWPVARISFMEGSLPRHLRVCEWPRAGAFGRLYFPNGSQIWGIPEGGDVVRSNTSSVVFADEAAFQPEFGASYGAALPAVKGGGQYIAVSSANPGEFQSLVGAEAA